MFKNHRYLNLSRSAGAIALVILLSFPGITSESLGRSSDMNTGKAVLQGGVAAFYLKGESNTVIDGAVPSFDGGEAFLVSDGNGLWGIVAAGIDTKPGQYDFTIKGLESELSVSVEVVREEYGVERLTLPTKMVDLDPVILKRVNREAALTKGLWSASFPRPLWKGPFIMPAEGRRSGEFGTRRILNGKAKSPHSGIDVAAPSGTPIKAAATGRVVYVGDFYFKGRFVVIDHGLGVFTEYSHMKKTAVKASDSVKRGDFIGEIGKSGRVTGPHLHFSVRVGSLRVSPELFYDLIEKIDQHPGLQARSGWSGDGLKNLSGRDGFN